MKFANTRMHTIRGRPLRHPWAWLCAVLMMAVLNGCGRSGPPKPLGTVLPVPTGLVAWQRDGLALVAWRLPEEEARNVEQEEGDSEQADKAGEQDKIRLPFGALQGHRLLIEQLPLNCPSCPPDDSRELALPLHSKSGEESESGEESGSVVLGPRVIYTFPLPAQAVTWRVWVAARYEDGLGRFSNPVYFDSPVAVPEHRLNWTAVDGSGAIDERLIRLYWQPRRERIVRTLTRDGAMVEQDLNFRVNLFRRMGDAPWPLRPLNIQPLKTNQLTLSVPVDEVVRFQMRLVDRFGNEGPASPAMVIRPETVKQ